MSTSAAVSISNCVAAQRQASAKSFGEHICLARLNDGRCLEELAPKAGLTIEEWQAIEGGQLPGWEQVLLLAIVLRIGPKWMKRLRKLCERATRQEPGPGHQKGRRR